VILETGENRKHSTHFTLKLLVSFQDVFQIPNIQGQIPRFFTEGVHSACSPYLKTLGESVVGNIENPRWVSGG
jgi:hypothetical protein